MINARTAWAPAGVLLLVLLSAAPLLAQPTRPTTPAVTGIRSMAADLSGGNVAPSPGEAGASGRAFLIFNPGRQTVCYRLSVAGIKPPNAAHIHEGAAGASGGPVVNFDLARNGLSGCVSNVDPQLMARIVGSPSGFYVNVHNEDFPGGAIRGQLAD